MIKKALILFVLSSTHSLVPADTLLSDPKIGSQSFSFKIRAHGIYIPLGRLFVAADENVIDNNFAIASAHRSTTVFTGLTPAVVTHNNTKDQKNPLHGAAISYLALLGSRPVVVKRDQPSSLFLIDDATEPLVFEASPVCDALGKPAQSVLALATSAEHILTPLDRESTMAIFEAIGNSGGSFDGDGSGIALIFFKRFTDTKAKRSFFALDSVDAKTGISQFNQAGELQGGGNKAHPIDRTTPAIRIHSPVAQVGSAVDLHYDRDSGRLYCALQVQAGNGPEDGARALVLASVTNGKMLVQPIAPDGAFGGTNQIVGCRSPGCGIELFKVRTMQTRTHLRYLIVVSGNAANATQVYALPVVDNILSPSHGALANVRSAPVNLFSSNSPFRFQGRVFADPAERPEDLFTKDSVPARVGGGVPLPGTVSDITISSEAAFVSVKEYGNGLSAGIFYSQPLFDELGRINGWTAWQRVAASASPVIGFVYDPLMATFSYLPLTSSGAHTVLRTAWSDPRIGLSNTLRGLFGRSQGGVQHIADFPFTTQGFSQVLGNRLSVQIFTGYKKVVLLQTGRDASGLFEPFIDLERWHTSQDGTLQNFATPSGIIFSGGALDELGPINSAAVLVNQDNGWFVVGGARGVALLSDENGNGWQRPQGLGGGFRGLKSGMVWKKISDAQNVLKLIAVDNSLFILTSTSVQRIDIDFGPLVKNDLSTTLLASTEDCERSFADLIVSGPLALLATSTGLMRSGNAVDIRKDRSAHWKRFELSESAGSLTTASPVTRLFAITQTLDERDVAHQGNVYLLNGSVAMSQAHLYRLYINLKNGLVTDDTVRMLPDYFIKGTPTFLASLGDYRNYLITDGALIAVSRSAFGESRPLLELLSPTIKSGDGGATRGRVPFVVIEEQAHSIGKLIRSSASGAWIVPGDFGVRIQE